jgi:ribose transport system ATP-binding protein
MADDYILRMQGVTKRFPGVTALENVDLELRSGEVLALMGENGAGKSTLMKILGGAQPPDDGALFIHGQAVAFRNVSDSRRHGIVLVHQELMLAANLDVAGNIFLGSEKSRWGLLRRRNMRAASESLLRRVGLSCSPATLVSTLTPGQMQMVEIAKALSHQAKILILDEPTSSLTLTESEQLFKIIGDLRRGGIAIIYISHRMEEVQRLADRVIVLRDGKRVGALERQDITQNKIVSMMVGRELTNWYPPLRGKRDYRTILRVENVIVPGSPCAASFDAGAGEILGFAGLVGSGRTELMQTLFGITPPRGGTITVDGKPFVPQRPRDAISRGIYLAPEDRKHHGLVLAMSIAQNISMPDIHHYKPRLWLQRGQELAVAQKQAQTLRIKAPGVKHRVGSLSGGNQQKVVLAKWLAMRPKILILDEPTRGVDVGAKAEIYREMMELAQQGITILMVSSEMEEVLGMSDRIVVMRERRIEGILPRDQATQERIASLMTGAGDIEKRNAV